MSRSPWLREWESRIKTMSVHELLQYRDWWQSKGAKSELWKAIKELRLRGIEQETDSAQTEEAHSRPVASATPPKPKAPNRTGRSRVMYIEYKGDGLAGTAWIGRVHFSKTGKMLYYRDQRFQSLKGGYKANYYDVETGDNYWISGCKKDGDDTLYPGSIEVDEDVREEYWLKIRKQPEHVHLKRFRSEGKYSKRRPK